MTLSRGIALGVGSLILAYGIFSLRAGWVISTWARIEYRPSAVYWITVVALLGIGGVNVALGIMSFIWPNESGTRTESRQPKEDSAAPASEQVKKPFK